MTTKKFPKSWRKWAQLPERDRWNTLQDLDRLSYDHVSSWILGAMREVEKENEQALTQAENKGAKLYADKLLKELDNYNGDELISLFWLRDKIRKELRGE